MSEFGLAGLLPEDFGNDSRVWIYQSSRAFREQEENEINEQLLQFYSQWLSHGKEVKGWASILFKQFIVVMADEQFSGVSGCSTDGMVRIIKSIERQYGIELFDRLSLTFLVEGKPQMLPLNQVQYALDKNFISPETLLFDNTVSNKEELKERWMKPLNKSWLASRLTLV